MQFQQDFTIIDCKIIMENKISLILKNKINLRARLRSDFNKS